MIQKQEAIDLLPPAFKDKRGETFIAILWEIIQIEAWFWRKEVDSQLSRSIAAFAPNTAPFTSRLSAATRRQLLQELPELVTLAGTPYALRRSLQLFGYTATFIENPSNTPGTYQIKIAETFTSAEVRAIVEDLGPIGRKLLGILPLNPILLDGSRLLDGSSILA